jgi:hypothetical protein
VPVENETRPDRKLFPVGRKGRSRPAGWILRKVVQSAGRHRHVATRRARADYEEDGFSCGRDDLRHVLINADDAFPNAARSRATGMPAPQPRSRIRPLPDGKPPIRRATDRRNAEPFEIDVCDFVVARDDNAFSTATAAFRLPTGPWRGKLRKCRAILRRRKSRRFARIRTSDLRGAGARAGDDAVRANTADAASRSDHRPMLLPLPYARPVGRRPRRCRPEPPGCLSRPRIGAR